MFDKQREVVLEAAEPSTGCQQEFYKQNRWLHLIKGLDLDMSLCRTILCTKCLSENHFFARPWNLIPLLDMWNSPV